MMNLKSNKNYSQIINKAMKEIMQPLELNGHTDKNGNKSEWTIVNLIHKAIMNKEGNQKILKVE